MITLSGAPLYLFYGRVCTQMDEVGGKKVMSKDGKLQ